MSEPYTPTEFFNERRERESDGWYMPESKADALAYWDRMMAAHDAELLARVRAGIEALPKYVTHAPTGDLTMLLRSAVLDRLGSESSDSGSER